MKDLIRAFALDGATVRSQRIVHIALAAIVLVLWILHALLTPSIFPVDDAYITLTNAEVIAGATDHNYGVSGFVGATSSFHVLLTSAFCIVLPGTWALHTVAWLGVLAYVQGVARLGFVHKLSLAETLVLAIVATVAGEIPHQLMNGLETGWAMAALAWTLAMFSDEVRRPRSVAALCALLPLLRPELAVVSLLIFALQMKRHFNSNESKRAAIRAIGIDIAVAVATVLPFVLAVWIATGAPIPSTVSAKRNYFAEGCLPATVKQMWLRTNLWDFVGVIGLLSAGAVFLALNALGRIGLVFVVVLLYAYYREFPGALAHYEHRYLYVSVSFLVYGLASTIRHPLRAVRIAAVAVAVLAMVSSLVMAPAAWQRHMRGIDFTVDELATVAEWSAKNIPPSATVLVHDAGYIAFGTDLRLIDLVGLKNERAAQLHEQFTWPSCGARRHLAIHQLAVETQPQFLIVLIGWERIFQIARGLAHNRWGVQLIRPPGEAGYAVFKLTPPAR